MYLSSPPSPARDPTRYLVSLFLVDSVQLNPSANSSHEWHRYSTCIGFSQLRSAVAKRCSWPRAHCHARIGLVRYSLVTDFSFPRFLNKKRRREIDLEGNRSIFSKRNDENEVTKEKFGYVLYRRGLITRCFDISVNNLFYLQEFFGWRKLAH